MKSSKVMSFFLWPGHFLARTKDILCHVEGIADLSGFLHAISHRGFHVFPIKVFLPRDLCKSIVARYFFLLDASVVVFQHEGIVFFYKRRLRVFGRRL